MITIYTLTYNEELLIKFMINHYRERFPGCRIVIHDNMSTDNTAKIAFQNNCEIVPFDTGGQFQDRRHMDIKNNCWRGALTDWVLLCDLDELADIYEAELKAEEDLGTSMIMFETYDMINMENNLDIAGMKYGVKSPLPAKFLIFNKKLINEINYSPGAHSCEPVGIVCYSSRVYRLYHYNSINEQTTIEKFKVLAPRLSPENLEKGWGYHYFMTPEEIRKEYAEERAKAVKIR